MGRSPIIPFAVLAAAVVATVACEVGSSTDTGPVPTAPTAPTAPLEGSVAFWTNASRGWSSINIWLGGTSIGRLTRYLNEAPSNCAANGGAVVVIKRRPGNYSYRAESDRGSRWNGQVTVSPGGCRTLMLSCGSDRLCEGAPPPPPPPRPTRSCRLVKGNEYDFWTNAGAVAWNVLLGLECNSPAPVRFKVYLRAILVQRGRTVDTAEHTVILSWPSASASYICTPAGSTECYLYPQYGRSEGYVLKYDSNACQYDNLGPGRSHTPCWPAWPRP